MGVRRAVFVSVWVAATWGWSAFVCGQQTTVVVPGTYLQDGYSELFGLGWGYSQPTANGGWFFGNGGPGWGAGGAPMPGAAQLGGQFRLGNGLVRWNLMAGQSSSRSMGVVAPSLTLTPGAPAYLFSGGWHPFVLGWVPVVGDQSVSPLAEALRRRALEASEPSDSGPRGETGELPAESRAPVRRERQADDPPLRLGVPR